MSKFSIPIEFNKLLLYFPPCCSSHISVFTT
jgi:hypothetical protein